MQKKENIIQHIYQAEYEKLDKIILSKIKENETKLKNIQEKESIKNAIIMEEMYKQGFKDGVNLIMQCQEQ